MDSLDSMLVTQLLERVGAIDSYSIVLKREIDQAAPGAGP